MHDWSRHGSMHNQTPVRIEPPRSSWHRQPVVWLGIFIFLASLGGCVWMIVLGSQHADEPVAAGIEHIMKMPLDRKNDASRPATEQL